MAYNTPPPFVTTGDNYQYLSCPGSAFVQALVLDAGILVGFGKMTGSLGPEAATYDVNDQPLLPGSNPIPQACDAVRFKSMTRGTPARVAISARPNSELPKDVALQTAYVPSYLVLNPDGTIGADFSGHVRAAGIELPASAVVPTGFSLVQWVDTRGTNRADIFGVYDGRQAQLILGPNPDSSFGIPQSGIQVVDSDVSTLALRTVYVVANGGVGFPGGAGVIADNLDRSSYWRKPSLFSNDGYKVQYGVRNVALGAGWGSYFCTLDNPWLTDHRIFIATVQVAAGASTFVGRSYISSLTQGQVDINSSIVQNATVQWCSVGF